MRKKSFLVLLLFLILLLSSCSGININDPGKSVPIEVERNIKNSDITWLENVEGASSVTIAFTANVKIKEISIKVDFLDKNDKLIHSATKSLNNLIPGQDYTMRFGLDFWDMLSVRKMSKQIVSGTVDLT
ncbi:MAG: hypothetical protein QXM38_03510 [Candidatus Aenigmatarchaeota archaeon]